MSELREFCNNAVCPTLGELPFATLPGILPQGGVYRELCDTTVCPTIGGVELYDTAVSYSRRILAVFFNDSPTKC